jgi:hypothetical protein
MTRWIGGALAGWLAVGLAGLAAYVYGYDAHRGFGATQTPAGVPRGHRVPLAGHPPHRALPRLPAARLRPGGGARRALPRPLLPARRAREDDLAHRRRRRSSDGGRADRAPPDPPAAARRARRRPGAVRRTEWANSPAGRWMDDVVAVVHDVDRRFATSPAAATAPSPATPRAPMARSTSRCTTWGCSASSRAGRATSGRRAAPCSRTRLPPRSPPTARRPRCGRSGARSAGSACAPGSTRAGRTAVIRRRRSTSPPICAGPAPRCGSASSPAATTGRCGGARRRGC